ncbi:PEP-CTERM sorting domain-containing protein [Massilia sp. METH4]|uniref:PEP-CTERM sorting domain-containing protein n=1 Tax=Massilia sp. METH4 TaxID=3123041 RepID=UPI0030CC2E7B
MQRLLCLAALAAFLIPGAASAAGPQPSELDITTRVGLSYQVIDLTPDDGIAAGFTTYTDYRREVDITHSTGQLHFTDTGERLDGVISVDRKGSEVAAGWTGVPGESELSIHLQDNLDGIATALSQHESFIRLDANSRIVITGDVFQSATAVGDGPFLVSSLIDIKLDHWTFESNYYNLISRSVFESSDTFVMAFANTTAQSVYLTLTANTRVVGSVSQVPEPTTWLMLGAGLLTIGTCARRRNGAAAHR